MQRNRSASRRGFSLIELLAAVLIVVVLAGLAIPLYSNTRKAGAARACRANIASIASAESSYALRNGGSYTGTMANLVGTSEGLTETPHCPLDNTTNYTLTVDGGTGALTISCSSANKTAHAAVVGTTADYQKVMAKTAPDSIP